MKPLELAKNYMEIFFGGGNPENLYKIFADDFSFSGPFYKFDSAEAYINSLKNEPPDNCRYEILKSFEDKTSACLLYEFSKPGINTLMAQIFEIHNEKIKRILLIFDTGAFGQDGA